MLISTVRYGHLFNLGNYENERIELEAQILPDEDWHAVLADLKSAVLQAGTGVTTKEDELATLENAIYRAEDRKRELQGWIESTEKRWKRITVFMEKVGLDLPRWANDEIPF